MEGNSVDVVLCFVVLCPPRAADCPPSCDEADRAASGFGPSPTGSTGANDVPWGSGNRRDWSGDATSSGGQYLAD
jgi:hypothetical protein